jgi:hypothetical protein
VLFDPEPAGIALQRITRVEDFQDLRSWRRVTVLGLRITRLFFRNVIVPMAFSNVSYLDEIRTALPDAHHVCLVAPLEVVQSRLRTRTLTPRDEAWQFRRAAECCAAHQDARFARHVDAAARSVEEIAREILLGIPSKNPRDKSNAP